MSMFRVVTVVILFNVALNILANVFATQLPGSVAYGGTSPQAYLTVTGSQSDLNLSQISTQQSSGFAIDPIKGISLLTHIKDYFLGGPVIAALFGMNPTSGTGAVVASAIDAFQGFIYLLAIIMIFIGRND